MHAAPQPAKPVPEAKIIATSRQDGSKGIVLLKVPGGACYEGQGFQYLGDYGSISLRKRLGIFSRRQAIFHNLFITTMNPPLGAYTNIIRDTINQRIATAPIDLQAWIKAILLGDAMNLSGGLQRAFLNIGIIHLLVVSGSHVAFFGFLCAGIIRFPGQLLYATRIIPARTFQRYAAMTAVVAAAVGILYATLTGLSIPSQRAMVLFVLVQLSKAFGGLLPKLNLLLLAAFLQSLLYPIGFVSESCLMSWCAYLIVITSVEAGSRKNLLARFQTACVLQIRLLVVAGAVFANLGLLSLLANLLVPPVFSLLMGSALLALLFPSSEMTTCIWLFHQRSIEAIWQIAALSPAFGGNLLHSSPMRIHLQGILVACALYITLNACHKLSIKAYDLD